jgi:glycosyltransferase involved in cell wall biosynthesis
MQDLLCKEARDIIFGDPRMNELIRGAEAEPWEMEEVWFRFVDRVSEKILTQFATSILDSCSGANVFDIFHTIGSVGSLYTMLAPYFVAYALFTKDRPFCRSCLERLGSMGGRIAEWESKIGHFTDTFHDVNGVARTLQQQVEIAQRKGKNLSIITCGPASQIHGVTNFEPIGTFEMPEYPGMRLYYPPLLEMMDYCYEQGFTHIHSATPGPIGLAALAIARALKLPLYGTYHTALPDYVKHLTEDASMGEFTWKYIVWYYNQMDVVYVPSKATGEDLAARGISEDKIRFYPRGIDIERFHPSKRNGFLSTRFGVPKDELRLLYVGRVSKEKNLPALVDVFTTLAEIRDDVRLIVVGDGPYLREMQHQLEGLPVTFTGFLSGDDLAQAYASSDIFLFPSTTDTFGNVVLEAQASGLPVIVTDEGGPKENLIPGQTGFVVPAGDVDAFVQRVLALTSDSRMLERMRKDARHYMENRSFESAFMELWDSYHAFHSPA